MKNVIILGANGNIAKHVIDILVKSLATLITKIIEPPEKYIHENLEVNKPNF